MKVFDHYIRRPITAVNVVVCSVCLFFLASEVQARDPAPVIEGATSSGVASKDLEARIQKIERRLDNQVMVEVLGTLDKMQQELQILVGQNEVLTHDIDNIKKRQRDLYVDLDRRLSGVEQKTAELAKGGTGTATGTAAAAAAVAAQGSQTSSNTQQSVAMVSPQSKQLEREAYERAFNLLREGRHDLAIASFKAYLETYPNADFADNAQYWLGEANYARKRYDVAIQEFNRVLDNYPKSNKRADAMLKMGFSFQELGKTDDAKEVLTNITKLFPDTTAARLAKKRLQSLKSR